MSTTAKLEKHIGLVYHVAHQIAARLPAEIDVSYLLGAGTLGLRRAFQAFDSARGLSFSTYATARIRGAILDDLRDQDTVPRSVRSKARRLGEAVCAVEQRVLRAARPTEVAGELGLPMEAYWAWRDHASRAAQVALDEPSPAGEGAALSDVLADSSPAADEVLDRQGTEQRLRAALEALEPRERLVIALSFYEELSQRQIAEVLKVTESRVSQIRTQALRRLRERLEQDAAMGS
jgi:RNA polymerase sigma factor for flagellar operon FliA